MSVGAAPAWRDRAREALGLDPRSLALLRIGTSALLLANLWERAPYFQALYGARGVLPEVLLDRLGAGWLAPYAAFRLGGSDAWIVLGAALSALFAVLLGLGCFTRLATAASWFLLASLNVRNPLATSYEDQALTLLLFFGFFLPLGARWSLDARRGVAPRTEAPFFSPAGAALIVQFGAIYFFTALLKTGGAWHDGSAVHYALAQHYHARESASLALGFPALLRLLTHATYFFELSVLFLLVSPVLSGPARTLGVLGVYGFHLGLASFMHLGLFPWTMMVGATALLPTWLWQRLGLRDAPPARSAEPSRHPALDAVPVVALVLGLGTNVAGLPWGGVVPDAWVQAAGTFRLDQRWGMYAPAPQAYDYYHRAAGTLADGRRLDLERGVPLPAEPPPLPWRGPSRPWSLYLDHARVHRAEGLAAAYMGWLCREWNATHQGADRLRQVDWTMEHFDMLADRAHTSRPLGSWACPPGP